MTTRLNVLVVDDCPMNTLIVQELLEDDFAVQIVGTGVDALRHARNVPPDLVLLDVMLPDMSGYDVCAALRATPRLGQVPIVMLSGCSDPAEIARGLAAGATAYLTKPFRPKQLTSLVGELLTKPRSADGVETALAGNLPGRRGGCGGA